MAKKRITKKDQTDERLLKEDSVESQFTAHYRLEARKDAGIAQEMFKEAGLETLFQTAAGWIVRTNRHQVERLTLTRIKETIVRRHMSVFHRRVVRRSFAGLPSDAPPPLDSRNLGRFIFPVPLHHWQPPAAYPPRPSYYHLHPHRDLPHLFGVERLHARGIRGQGIRVVMIDTGFFPHPYYNDPGIHAGTVPMIVRHSVLTNPNVDDYGHGTAIMANVFSLGPDCDFHVIKHDDDPLAGLLLATTLNPQIITCRWGYSEAHVADVLTNMPNSGEAQAYRDIQQAIQGAIAAGITVLFSSGNLAKPAAGPGNWPSSEPGVICVGGAFLNRNLQLRASSLATSFRSILNAGRPCPDVCGLVGPAPSGLLFPLPTQPQSMLDRKLSPLDHTPPDDGWCVTSGTSSAAPQLAGMAALLLQMHGPQSPQQILGRFQEMSVGVHLGKSATGDIANAARPNLATGWGWTTFRRPHSKNNYFFF